jgi:hypothetical protein
LGFTAIAWPANGNVNRIPAMIHGDGYDALITIWLNRATAFGAPTQVNDWTPAATACRAFFFNHTA